jgi:hypothetical protein
MCLCAVAPTFANDQPASAESIREVMEITKSRQLLDSVYAQFDGLMQQMVEKALPGKKLSAEQEKILAEMSAKMIDIIREEFNWEYLEPAFIDIYQKSFTQKEVDGMIAFYKTESGLAVIDKMPQVMQLSMQMTMERMQSMGPRIQALGKEMDEKLRVAK